MRGRSWTPESSLTWKSRQCVRRDLKSWLVFPLTAQRFCMEKRGVSDGYPYNNLVSGRRLGNIGDKGSENMSLQMSSGKAQKS